LLSCFFSSHADEIHLVTAAQANDGGKQDKKWANAKKGSRRDGGAGGKAM